MVVDRRACEVDRRIAMAGPPGRNDCPPCHTLTDRRVALAIALVVLGSLLRGAYLVEPQIDHDHELCVLAINGGRLLVLAGRSLMMERIVQLGDRAPAVASSDFGTPSWLDGMSIASWWRADEATRAQYTRRALTQIVEGDEGGRTIAQVLLDTTRALAESYLDGEPCAALRVDWFVRWESGGGAAGRTAARVWVNEVENSFNPCALVGWYGEQLTTLALRFWHLGGAGQGRDGARRQEAAVAEVDN